MIRDRIEPNASVPLRIASAANGPPRFLFFKGSGIASNPEASLSSPLPKPLKRPHKGAFLMTGGERGIIRRLRRLTPTGPSSQSDDVASPPSAPLRVASAGPGSNPRALSLQLSPQVIKKAP